MSHLDHHHNLIRPRQRFTQPFLSFILSRAVPSVPHTLTATYLQCSTLTLTCHDAMHYHRPCLLRVNSKCHSIIADAIFGCWWCYCRCHCEWRALRGQGCVAPWSLHCWTPANLTAPALPRYKVRRYFGVRTAPANPEPPPRLYTRTHVPLLCCQLRVVLRSATGADSTTTPRPGHPIQPASLDLGACAHLPSPSVDSANVFLFSPRASIRY